MILTVLAFKDLPTWLGAIATVLALATILGAAVAVYKTSIQSTSLKEARAKIEDLRGDIADYQRTETQLEGKIAILETEKNAANGRIKVLEDLLTKRQDDDAIRAEIAAVKKVVDENVLSQLTAHSAALATILATLERLEGSHE